VPEYQQTAALWTRGVLENEFGVKPGDMTFWMERNPDHSHAHATGFKHPPGVTINQIPHEKSIGSMMVSGELDAVVHYILNANMVDRSTVDLSKHPDIKTLFTDPRAEGIRYYEKSGIYPINHGMVIRREVAEAHPWAVLNLLKAFVEAAELADRQRMEHVEYYRASGLLTADAHAALREPLVRHGVVANRVTLETAARYSVEQGLTPRLVALEEVFAQSTLDQ